MTIARGENILLWQHFAFEANFCNEVAFRPIGREKKDISKIFLKSAICLALDAWLFYCHLFHQLTVYDTFNVDVSSAFVMQLSSFAGENDSHCFVYLCKLHLSDSWIIENPEKVTNWSNSRALLYWEIQRLGPSSPL